MADPDSRTRARFPDVPHDAGHYESFYLKASHPTEPLGIWVRYTVHKRPGQNATGSLWFSLFDAAVGRPYAAKETLPAPGSGTDDYIHVGDSRLGSRRADGRALKASWQLEFESLEEPFFHLPRDWMYCAKLPRTKLLSPHPVALFSGRAASTPSGGSGCTARGSSGPAVSSAPGDERHWSRSSAGFIVRTLTGRRAQCVVCERSSRPVAPPEPGLTDGRSLYDTFGFEWTLLRLGGTRRMWLASFAEHRR
jgi:hypothetical protein